MHPLGIGNPVLAQVNARRDKQIERIGQLFELAFAFLLLPLIVTTMDRPPLWLGGRILLWVVLVLLFALQPQDVRARMFQRMQPARSLPGGWAGPTILFLLSLAGLAVVLQMLGIWAPPAGVSKGGLPAALLIGLLGTLFTVAPIEIIFRVYIPMRFRGISTRPSVCVLVISTFLFAWLHIPSLDPVLLLWALVLGGVLALMERAGWPFWGMLSVHGLAAWAWFVAPKLFTEVVPWVG